MKGLSPANVSSYGFIVLIIAAIYFLQRQLYSYLIPDQIKITLSESPKLIKYEKFFSGGVDFGYLFVLLHMSTLFTDKVPSAIFLYLGLMLIVFGTVSRIKEILEKK